MRKWGTLAYAPGMAAKRAALARRRKALGLTQETLAELLGVERSTVVRRESGETAPAPWMRSKLAKALCRRRIIPRG